MSLSSSVRCPRHLGTRALGPCPAFARCRKLAAASFPAGYSINSILYQRGIYPPETFRRVNKYGLTMLVTTDDALNAYLENVLTQLSRAPPASPIPPAWAPARSPTTRLHVLPPSRLTRLAVRAQSGSPRGRCRSWWWWSRGSRRRRRSSAGSSTYTRTNRSGPRARWKSPRRKSLQRSRSTPHPNLALTLTITSRSPLPSPSP